MSMTKRSPSVATKRFPWSDQIHTYFELEFNGDVIKPGDKIRFKNRRGVFSFRDWCHNAEKDVTWINCVDDKSHQFRAFYMEELKSVIRPKRSRARKSKVVYIAKSK
jgi:hypothetical protein